MPGALHSMLVSGLLPLLLWESRTVTVSSGVICTDGHSQWQKMDRSCSCEYSAPDISPVFVLSSFTLSILAYGVCRLENHFFCVCTWCICIYMYADVYAGASAHVCARDVWNWCLVCDPFTTLCSETGSPPESEAHGFSYTDWSAGLLLLVDLHSGIIDGCFCSALPVSSVT